MENIQFQLAQIPAVKNSRYSHVTDFSIGFLETNVSFPTARWAGVEDNAWNEQSDETKIRTSTNTRAFGKDKTEEQRLEISLPAHVREGAVNL